MVVESADKGSEKKTTEEARQQKRIHQCRVSVPFDPSQHFVEQGDSEKTEADKRKEMPSNRVGRKEGSK